MGLAEFKGHVESEEKEAEGEEEPEHNLVDTVDGEHDPEIVHHNKRVVNVISGLLPVQNEHGDMPPRALPRLLVLRR